MSLNKKTFVPLLFFDNDWFGIKLPTKVDMPLNKETLNSTATVFLQGWLSHKITHEGWFAIKQSKKS